MEAFLADLPPLPDEPADMRRTMLDLLALAERDWTLKLADGREIAHPTIKRAREVLGVQS